MPLFGKKTPPPLWSSFPSSRRDRHCESAPEPPPYNHTAPDNTTMGNNHSRLLSLDRSLFSIARRPSSKKTLWDPPAYDSSDYTVSTGSDNRDTDAESRYAFLKDFDTIFLVDDSSSMKDGNRWKEARDAIAAITPICTQYDKDGIDIYFLNRRPDANDQEAGHREYYRNVREADEVRAIFQKAEPRGSTPMGRRLHDILDPYLRRVREASSRDAAGTFGAARPEIEPVKPINIIAITDGLFTDDAEGVIRDFARRLDAPGMRVLPWQVGIQFFQIGDDEDTRVYLQQLDDELGKDERLRDIVDTVPWRGTRGQRLDRDGILKCVLGAVNKKYDRWRVD